MPMINDLAFDAALGWIISNSSHLYICSTEPTTYTQATSTYALGNKAAPSIGAAADGSPNGRSIIVAAISGGSVTGTGTAAYWALVDSTNSRLVATKALSSSQSVTSGNTFSLTAITINIPDAS